MDSYTALKTARDCIAVLQQFDPSLQALGRLTDYRKPRAPLTAALHDLHGMTFTLDPSPRDLNSSRPDSLAARFMRRVDTRHLRKNEQQTITLLEDCLYKAMATHGGWQGIFPLLSARVPVLAWRGKEFAAAVKDSGVKLKDDVLFEATFSGIQKYPKTKEMLVAALRAGKF